MCWSKHESDVWPLIFSINTLRNEFAHQLDSPKIESKLQNTINLFLNSLETRESRKTHTAAAKHEQLKSAVIYCMGFLENFEGEAKFYRRMNDTFAAMRDSFAKSHPA